MDTICLFSGGSHHEALNVKEILESNNITCLMPNEHVSGVMPHLSLTTGGYTIFVSAAQFIQAGELLNSLNIKIENSHLIENLEILKKEKELEECPYCGNQSVEIILENRRGLIAFVFMLFSVPIKAQKVKKMCHICGEKQ
jgi:hypothetical protein